MLSLSLLLVVSLLLVLLSLLLVSLLLLSLLSPYFFLVPYQFEGQV